MKLVFKGGYVFNVDLDVAIVNIGKEKIVINWIGEEKDIVPYKSTYDSWTLPIELIENIAL